MDTAPTAWVFRVAERVWLVTGGSGQVGQSLSGASLPTGVRLWMPTRHELDLSDLPDMAAVLNRYGITAIVSNGAYTAVDKAESEPDLARSVNAVAPGRLADAAAQAGIPIVHLSTDYVFSGDGDAPRHERDPTGPTNVYGRTKLEGERAVLNSGARAVVLRTAWVVSPFGTNFVRTMLRLGAERQTLNVVADQFGNPTSATDIAAAVVSVLDRLETDAKAPTGVFHFVNAGSTSWHGLAEHVFARAATHGRTVPHVVPIPTSDYPTPAVRPANSRLSNEAIQTAFAIVPRPWQQAVDAVVDALVGGSSERGSTQ